MKHFLIVVLVCASFTLRAQADGPYLHEYKKGKSILMYSYVQRNDSIFISGYLEDKKSNAPVSDMNVVVKDFRLGTVSDRDGNFRLFLPRLEGTLVFDKAGFSYFEFLYRFKRDDMKDHSAHH